MKVILIDWNSYGNIYMKSLMEERGYDVCLFPFDDRKKGEDMESQKKNLSELLSGAQSFDYVFSYNYFPEISDICNQKNTKYISWVYDSPYLNIYSYTAINPVNYIFHFDYGVCSEFEAGGIKTVYHLPLGIYEPALKKYAHGSKNNFLSDVSFVGSLYNESKHRLYEKFDAISDYAKGYLEAIILAQKNIYGENILESLITPDIEAELQKAYPTDPNAPTVMTPAQIYSQFVLSRQVTALERREVLELLGKTGHDLNLYTNEKNAEIVGWENKGPVDYYDKMPEVFAGSRINLNITLRSIKTGIPLRAFDIMGAGGFLLTNYQAEISEFFTPGEDLAVYESMEDLLSKVEYYLSHENERAEIAENGCRKVYEEHTLAKKLDYMEEVAGVC